MTDPPVVSQQTFGSPPTGQSCGTCKYTIQKTSGSNTYYECHYNPPDSNKNPNNWPQVATSDWCGQWIQST